MQQQHAQDVRAQNGTQATNPTTAPQTGATVDGTRAGPAWYGRSYDAFTWLSLLGGLWIAISPWVINFASASPRLAINNLVIGLAAAFIAMGSMTALRGVTGSGLANAVLGVWVIVTTFVPLTAPESIVFMISQIVGGAVILVFAVAGQLGSQKLAG